MPEMTGDVPGGPEFAVMQGIGGSVVGKGDHQASSGFQQAFDIFPVFVQVIQVFHDMPQGDDIKGFRR